MTQQVMNQAEGAAIHIQLDSMVKALRTFDDMAGEAGDQDVLRLMAKLHEAEQAARVVACRRSLAPQVVSLAKR